MARLASAELTANEDRTVPGRSLRSIRRIYETDDALSVVLEMPGVEKKDLDVALECPSSDDLRRIASFQK
jgi:HSP20 family molecular chaperone IbpA